MTPEQLRAMYASESAARSPEAQATQKECLTDPAMARNLLLTLYALGGDSAEFAELLSLVVNVGTMQMIAIQAAKDDTFALHIAGMIIEGMQGIAQVSAPRHVRRGRTRPARSA